MKHLFAASICISYLFLSGCFLDPLLYRPTVQMDDELAQWLSENYPMVNKGGNTSPVNGPIVGEEIQLENETVPRNFAPPDLCLVLVDSLRPDHLGCYGYERETSPAVDTFGVATNLFSKEIVPTNETVSPTP